MKDKKPKTQMKYENIFMFLICVFNLWFLVFNFDIICVNPWLKRRKYGKK